MPPGSFQSPGKWQLLGDMAPALRVSVPRVGAGARKGRTPCCRLRAPRALWGILHPRHRGRPWVKEDFGVGRRVSLPPKLDRPVRATCTESWGEGWGQAIWGREWLGSHSTLKVCAREAEQTEEGGRRHPCWEPWKDSHQDKENSDSRTTRSAE